MLPSPSRVLSRRVRESLWCHVEFSAAGRIETSYPALPPLAASFDCACALAGWGDAALPRFTELLRGRANQEQTHGRRILGR